MHAESQRLTRGSSIDGGDHSSTRSRSWGGHACSLLPLEEGEAVKDHAGKKRGLPCVECGSSRAKHVWAIAVPSGRRGLSCYYKNSTRHTTYPSGRGRGTSLHSTNAPIACCWWSLANAEAGKSATATTADLQYFLSMSRRWNLTLRTLRCLGPRSSVMIVFEQRKKN